MSYRSILVHLDRSAECAKRVQAAVALGIQHQAMLIGIAPTGLPFISYSSGMEGVALYYLETAKALHEDAQTCITMFGTQTNAMKTINCGSFIAGNEESAAAVARHGRGADLIVLGQTNPYAQEFSTARDFVEYVLLHSGRPVLILPYAGDFPAFGKNVVVAWDGGRESARAVADALPILKTALKVTIMVFNQTPSTGSEMNSLSVTGIDSYLKRHGVNAELSHEQSNIDIGNALLSRIADYGADLLVMGGYSHSRFREAILGGATKTVLSDMTVPVLMSH